MVWISEKQLEVEEQEVPESLEDVQVLIATYGRTTCQEQSSLTLRMANCGVHSNVTLCIGFYHTLQHLRSTSTVDV